ncbi:MAG: ROK family protein [Elusimicrobia bacterium]|nr:ROK family protein [Elusimicrobiota bacterium]
MAQHFLIGIDIGGTKIYGGLLSPSGRIVATRKIPMPPGASSKKILEEVHSLIRKLLKDGEATPSNILGIGVAVPGIVDHDGVVVNTPNIAFSGTPLRTLLEKKYKRPVAVGNDANLGTLGEQWLGAGRKARNIIGVFPGTGVGGGMIVDGRIIGGTHGAAAEIGHMPVDPQGPRCSCGNTGCLEAVAGRWAIERDIRAAVKKGTRSAITRIVGKDLRRIKSSALAKALKAKDPLVTRTIQKAAEALARACVSLNHLLDPDMFIFGGGVIEACGDWILPAVEKALKADPFFQRLGTPVVVAAKLGDDAVMLGAAALVRREIPERLLTNGYYPRIAQADKGRIRVGRALYAPPFFIRADGKIKGLEKKETTLSPRPIKDICKKGPEALFIICPKRKRACLSTSARDYLKKNKTELYLLPISAAIKAYNACGDRKTIAFL